MKGTPEARLDTAECSSLTLPLTLPLHGCILYLCMGAYMYLGSPQCGRVLFKLLQFYVPVILIISYSFKVFFLNKLLRLFLTNAIFVFSKRGSERGS